MYRLMPKGKAADEAKTGLRLRYPAFVVITLLRRRSPARPARGATYGSTNKYQPVNRSKASGNTAKRPTREVYFPCMTATMLTMTATVKAMHSQRWVCRTHLFQFNGTSSEDEPEADQAHLPPST